MRPDAPRSMRTVLATPLVAFFGVAIACLACGPGPGGEQEALNDAGVGLSFVVPEWSGTWYKGNTHTHTTESDGDSSPEYVARWYKDHGYDWLVLSDHNVFTDPATLAHLVDETFLLIPGEEVTSSFEDASVHVNGLNLPGLVEARSGETLVATIQANVDAIREVEGVPHINHPNFRWSFGVDELRQVRGDRLLEIFNGHPTVHNEGGGGTPGLVEVWDMLLTEGKEIYGIAVDDAHHFQGEFEPDRSNPGRGWVSVRAETLEPSALMDALEAGHFYASTGVALEGIDVAPERVTVRIAADRDFRYTTTFIGAGGRRLHRTTENPAVFELSSHGSGPGAVSGGAAQDDGAKAVHYVRAEVQNSRGDVAWIQPVFLKPGRLDPPPG